MVVEHYYTRYCNANGSLILNSVFECRRGEFVLCDFAEREPSVCVCISCVLLLLLFFRFSYEKSCLYIFYIYSVGISYLPGLSARAYLRCRRRRVFAARSRFVLYVLH